MEKETDQNINLIITDVTSCVQCLCCQMACSIRKQGVFNPDLAFIRIDKVLAEITFTEQCDQCGYCIPFCMYGAIKVFREKGEGANKHEAKS